MRVIYLLLVTSLILGCSTIGNKVGRKHSATAYAEKLVTRQGKKAAPPILLDGNHRLMVFIEKEEPEPIRPQRIEILDAETGEKVPVKERKARKVDKEIIVAVAENDENKGVLVRLHQLLMENEGTTVYLYGKEIESGKRWNEYADGIDLYMIACGVYVPRAHKYFIVQATFGDHWTDSINWKTFVKTVFKQGVKIVK